MTKTRDDNYNRGDDYMSKIKVATLQGKWTGDFDSNNAWYVEQARALKGKGYDLVVLPELFHTPYFPFEENADFFDLAIEKDHPIVGQWQAIAKELNAVVVFPFFEKRARGIYHNSAFVFERDGSIAGLYRKSHIPDDPAFYEKYYFIPGDTGFEPIKTSAGTLGVLICWDQWFPEAARIMSLKGADVLIYPTAIGWMDSEPKEIYPRQQDSWRACHCEPHLRDCGEPWRHRRPPDLLGHELRRRTRRLHS